MFLKFRRRGIAAGLGLLSVLAAMPVMAAEARPLDPAATVWVLVSTALVLFMTLPGLALFYAGLVRARNALSVLAHCVLIACMVSLLWFALGYSLAFTDGGAANAWLGGLDRAFLAGVTADTLKDGLPEIVFFLFQMTFAIITPALIVGAYPERAKFAAVLGFSAAWLLLVYVPVCHWIWGGGWLADIGVIDFAGGLVVHVTAGVAAIACALMFGRRRGFPHEMPVPHSPGLTMAGAGMLWVGWYGFNGGSALAANGAAGFAIAATHLAASAGALTWMAIEWGRHGRPSLVGLVTGLVAGLATVTPAAGVAGPLGGMLLGIAGGVVCFNLTAWIKHRLRLDDSLDVFAVHGVGGALGILMVPVVAGPGLGGSGLAEGITMGGQFLSQGIGLLVTAGWSGLASLLILALLRAATGLRVDAETEFDGLDVTVHGERAYDIR